MKNKNINILMISAIYPFPFQSGSHYFQYNLVKELSKQPGINLYLLTFVPPGSKRNKKYESMPKWIKTVKLLPNRNSSGPYANGIYLLDYFITTAMVRAFKKTVRNIDFDVIHFEHIQTAGYEAILQEFGLDIPAVFVEHDCLGIAERQRRAIRDEKNQTEKKRMMNEQNRLENYQKQIYGRFDKVIAFSQNDAQWIKNFSGAENITVIPDAIDTGSLCPARGITPEPGTVLFIGTAAHPSTAPALEKTLNQIFPKILKARSDSRLLIAGKGMEKLAKSASSENVEVLGYVDDLPGLYHRAKVLLAPVWDSGGVRTKILEAMAAGTPVVTTPLGIQGIAAHHQKQVMIGNTAAQLAKHTLTLMLNQALYTSVRKNAQILVRRRHSWKNTAGKYIRLYQSVAQRA